MAPPQQRRPRRGSSPTADPSAAPGASGAPPAASAELHVEDGRSDVQPFAMVWREHFLAPEVRGLTPTARDLWILLLSYCAPSSWRVGKPRLARELGKDQRHIDRALVELVRARLVRVQREKAPERSAGGRKLAGGDGWNRYVMLTPPSVLVAKGLSAPPPPVESAGAESAPAENAPAKHAPAAHAGAAHAPPQPDPDLSQTIEDLPQPPGPSAGGGDRFPLPARLAERAERPREPRRGEPGYLRPRDRQRAAERALRPFADRVNAAHSRVALYTEPQPPAGELAGDYRARIGHEAELADWRDRWAGVDAAELGALRAEAEAELAAAEAALAAEAERWRLP